MRDENLDSAFPCLSKLLNPFCNVSSPILYISDFHKSLYFNRLFHSDCGT